MSDQHDPSKPVRTLEWIVFSCLTTLLSANFMILRPDPATTAFKRTLLILILNVKTLLFPQLVLFEAVTQYETAKVIRDRVNAAAEQCHKASLPSNNVGPAFMDSPQTMWDKIKSWVFGKKIRPLRLVCETGDGYNQRLDFEKWTTAHGHFALMGGFTVGIPTTTDDRLPLYDSPGSQKVLSLKPRQLFALFEKEDPRKARFDLFTQVSEAQIKQLHEYSSTGHLITIIGRLLMFVWYCCRRQHLGLETSPLEVLTVGHVFMAVVIEIFWWNKPPYLRLPIQNLDRQALCQAVPGLDRELEDVAAAQGKNTVGAYMSLRNFRVHQWLTNQPVWRLTHFDGVGLGIHANYRTFIVSGLCACHSAIIVLPTWRMGLGHIAGGHFDFYLASSAIIAFVAALDTVAWHLSDKIPKFRKLHNNIWGYTPLSDIQDDTVASHVNYAMDSTIFFSGTPILVFNAAAVLFNGLNFRQASKGIYAVGPGDVPEYDLDIFGTQ